MPTTKRVHREDRHGRRRKFGFDEFVDGPESPAHRRCRPGPRHVRGRRCRTGLIHLHGRRNGGYARSNDRAGATGPSNRGSWIRQRAASRQSRLCRRRRVHRASERHGRRRRFVLDEFVVIVTNRPSSMPARTATYEGDVVELASSTFTDAERRITHEATIDWGDVTVEPGIVDQAAGSVAGSHTYADDGVYIVRVTVSDDDGDSGFEEFVVTVSVSELVALSGRVFDDRDNDGLLNWREAMRGWKAVTAPFRPVGQARKHRSPLPSRGTEGQYAFGNLRSGTYKLVEIQPRVGSTARSRRRPGRMVRQRPGQQRDRRYRGALRQQ